MIRNIISQLNDVEKQTMEKLLNNRNLMQVQASRFQVVLNRAKGKGTNEIEEMLHIHPVSVSQIVRRSN
jgi:predicted mannosyl-3-phosphoglycerate phosphatase (HAD superfamily)